MKEPIWINKDHVLWFHDKQIDTHGGSSGVRDEKRLESALARPQQLFAYESPDLFDLAASYALGIIKNHAFIDGNKRTGMVTAGVFLRLNGCVLKAPEPELVITAVKTAAGMIDQAELAEWFRKYCNLN